METLRGALKSCAMLAWLALVIIIWITSRVIFPVVRGVQVFHK